VSLPAEPPLAALTAVRCGAGGEETHRVGVTVRGQAVMLDHDRRLERVAEGLEAEARTPCALVYDHLRAELATRSVREAVGNRMLMPTPHVVADADAEALEAYVDGARGINRRRADRTAHTTRLTSISVLAGGPPHLAPWVQPGAPHAFREPDAVVRQAQVRARQGVLERLIPGLFLRAGYPIVARHPPTGPGVKRGACWHVTVTDLGPDDRYAVHSVPHPDGRRVCHGVAVPLGPSWYQDVYKEGLALLDGGIVVKLGEPGSGGPGASAALLFVQQGAHFRLADVVVERTRTGWRRLPAAIGVPVVGTGARPSPWD
jgi:hypothetical protein